MTRKALVPLLRQLSSRDSDPPPRLCWIQGRSAWVTRSAVYAGDRELGKLFPSDYLSSLRARAEEKDMLCSVPFVTGFYLLAIHGRQLRLDDLQSDPYSLWVLNSFVEDSLRSRSRLKLGALDERLGAYPLRVPREKEVFYLPSEQVDYVCSGNSDPRITVLDSKAVCFSFEKGFAVVMPYAEKFLERRLALSTPR